MSNQPDSPWTEEEKYALLTEILKKAGIPSNCLVRIINDLRISPNWDNIPLPHGRSLNSCKLAFFHMTQPNAPGPSQAQAPTQAPRPPPPPTSAGPPPLAGPPPPPPAPTPPILSTTPRPIQQHHQSQHHQVSHHQDLRKRPLDHPKPPPAPRAIQPKPPASNASYSSESPAPLSPRWSSIGPGGEPPRKRGRPSKAETERRRAAAQARGETYPPPRRSGSNRARPGSGSGSALGLSIPPSPTSPNPTSASASASTSMTASASASGYSHVPSSAPPAGLMPASVPYDVHIARTLPGGVGVGIGAGTGGGTHSSPIPGPNPHEIPNRAMGLRELPRPDMAQNHPLPSPHALQLGIGLPDAFRPRINSAGERMFGGPGHGLGSPGSGPGSTSGTGPPDRFTPVERRHSTASAGANVRDRELGSGNAGYSDLRNSSTSTGDRR
ncbi:hypothetical protein PENSTE_c001G02741 [Penicillium steckii]|uniref:Myb-like domain-containing protein n=1 Tax=Penicillium steckii TaxID=303698 RepID=A0A1V6U090_9EURO|nr:hypothetical protein PENSTE_c001G02741 [Penicillium steckii]